MRKVTLYDHPEAFACEEDGIVYEMPSGKEYYEYRDGSMPLDRQIIIDKIMVISFQEVIDAARNELREALELKEWCEQNGETDALADTSFGSLYDRITELLHEIEWCESAINQNYAHAEECQKLLNEQQKQESNA